MLSAIVNQYFISKDYDSTLPGLDDTTARRVFMGAHMGLGLICMCLYPLQFFGCIRKRFPIFHRWSGRASLISAFFVSVCGIVFICLKKFQLVGGINMGIAFFIAGLVFGTCAVMTGYFARKRDIRRHRNWAIRSYSQILASMIYRYYYAVLGGLGAVHGPADGELECNENDVCDYFLKPFDAVHAWTFFIFPLLIAEAIVYLLRDQVMTAGNVKDVIEQGEVETNGDKSSKQQEEAEANSDKSSMEQGEVERNGDNSATKDVNGKKGATDRNDTVASQASINGSSQTNNFLFINLFGILLAVIYLGSTVFIYVTAALGVNSATFH